MILTGPQISAEVAAGRITITPFNPVQVTPTSYDLRLGGTVLRYRDTVLDPARKPDAESITIPPAGLAMKAGDFLLGASAEDVATDHFAGLIHAKSSIARLGLFVHVTSDLIHIGSAGNITFQLYATLPVTLRAGMLIGQITFWQPKGDITLYRGKYHGATGPRASEVYRDFNQ